MTVHSGGLPVNIGRVLAQGALPLIVVSSGSMGNNGALTGVTAVLAAGMSAYIYLPAGAIATASAAGLYYAVFSSTTAATVYNNTYTSGVPSVPASPTAFVTTGPGSFTQVTTEITLLSLIIPANTMGPNGKLQISTTFAYGASSANAKTLKIKFGATTYRSFAPTTSTYLDAVTYIANAGATNLQIGNPTGQIALNTAATANATLAGVDTTADVTFAITAQLAAAAETISLLQSTIMLQRP